MGKTLFCLIDEVAPMVEFDLARIPPVGETVVIKGRNFKVLKVKTYLPPLSYTEVCVNRDG